MSLDLDDLLANWNNTPGEISARALAADDGAELIQLRIELGLLQMFPDGRPDGSRYHGAPTALDYVAHEQREEHELAEPDIRELEREITQFNYRRLALAAIADDALRRDDQPEAVRQLLRAVRDIDQCLRRIRLVDQLRQRPPEQIGLKSTLTFNRARLLSQLRVVQGRNEDAIRQATEGANALEELLLSCGLDPEQAERDPGVQYLQQLAARLRKQYAIPRTLQEQLDAAIESEDFAAAARLRERIRREQGRPAKLESAALPPELDELPEIDYEAGADPHDEDDGEPV